MAVIAGRIHQEADVGERMRIGIGVSQQILTDWQTQDFSSSTVTEMEIFGSEFSPNTHKLPN
jgi:hypothetical protein